MVRFVGIAIVIGTLATASMAADCPGLGREIGAPVPDLKTPAYYEPGKPKAITIKNAKMYRFVHGKDERDFEEFVAVRDGRLVAVVQEFPPEDRTNLVSSLIGMYGKGESEDPDAVPEKSDPPIGFAAKVLAQQSWNVMDCGFAIRYVEAIDPTAVFGVTPEFKLRAVVWTKALNLPVVKESTGAIP